MAPATTQVRLGGTLLTSVPDDDDDEGGAGGGGAPATMGSVSEASGAPPAGCWLEWPRGPDAERCDALLKDVEPATVADVCRMASPSGQETRARPGPNVEHLPQLQLLRPRPSGHARARLLDVRHRELGAEDLEKHGTRV